MAAVDKSTLKKWMSDASTLLRSLEVGRRLLEEEVGDVVRKGMSDSDAAVRLKCSMISNLMKDDVDNATTNIIDIDLHEYKMLSKSSLLKKIYKLTDNDIISKIDQKQIAVTVNSILSEIMIQVKIKYNEDDRSDEKPEDMIEPQDSDDLLYFTKLLDLKVMNSQIKVMDHAQIEVRWNLT